MPLRCFLFSSDEGTVAILRQILSSLGVEAEFCSTAVTAAQKITNENFQIVIIDWDQQPEAGVLLTTARDRKAAERPLTLAIVSDDASGPHALHAGANSLLRKPIAANQARETLVTARDLIHAKQGSPVAAAQAAAAAGSGAAQRNVSLPVEPVNPAPARPPQMLQRSDSSPATLFEAEAKTPRPSESPKPTPAPAEFQVEPKPEKTEQEENRVDEAPAPSESEGRGLQWYMKARAAEQAPAPAPSRGNPDLIGFQQTASYAPKPAPAAESPIIRSAPPRIDSAKFEKPVSKNEPPLFSSIQGQREPSRKESAPASGFKKRAIVAALILAAIATFVAPQAPWHPTLRTLWRNGRQAIHGWLYPQPVTPVQAPAAHESFYRPGDEYKLPAAEPIPDATTDPSQIEVLPAVDPTAKKPTDASTTNQPVGLPDPATNPEVPGQSPGTHVPENQSSQPAPAVTQPVTPAPAPTHPAVIATTSATAAHESTVLATESVPNPPTPRPVPPRAPSTPANVPQSLKSQLTSMTPDSSGNKAPETALPTIEPVSVQESQERALLIDQPAPAYPASAKGQQGTVTLQVLIGRDGTVQDAKFLQGSLLFARSAIDAVKRWKFKPYIMNTRPVSVQTVLTLKFKPGQ